MSKMLRIISPEKIDTIVIPGPSKSIGNRLLLISAIKGDLISLPENSAEDLKILHHILLDQSRDINVGESGTALRFLIAFFALVGKEVSISGEGRLHKRPVGPLVQALQELGARISYEGEEGFAPLRIHKAKLNGGKVRIDAGMSSQFISALLLIAPYLDAGLEIEKTGDAVSVPYTDLTVSLMRLCGAEVNIDGEKISVSSGTYKDLPGSIEGDWSSAAFWYQASAIHNDANVSLKDLFAKSAQGDSELINIFSTFGVTTEFGNGILKLTKGSNRIQSKKEIDLRNHPDLAPSVVLTCAALFLQMKISGLETLTSKESDRISALVQGLKACGYGVESDGKSFIQMNGKLDKRSKPIIIDSQKDHRIAMAFAMMSCTIGEIIITDTECVSKSYPNFWKDLKNAGFMIESVELRK